MTNSSSNPNPDDEILAQFIQDLERTDDFDSVLNDYTHRYPNRAGEFRELVEMRQVVADSRPIAPASMPQQLGEFRIVRRLETGGMGEVYETWHDRLQRRVAIKVLRHSQHSQVAQDRFMREQHVLAHLHQTNIVPIHTAGRDGEIEYFAMPYIDGAALRHVVQTAAQLGSTEPERETPSIAELVSLAHKSGVATPTRTYSEVGSGASTAEPAPGHAPVSFKPSMEYLRSVAKVIADAATAMHHAHEHGILHRDLKPSNIMVEVHEDADGKKSDQCWVIDFGLASYRNGHTAPVGNALRGVPSPAVQEAGTATRNATEGVPYRSQNDSHQGRSGAPESIPAASGVMGTPPYMAPEQFDKKADARTDVWGLGVTLYELLTLRRAFPDEPGDQTRSADDRFAATRHRVQTINPPRPRRPIPRDLAAICFKAMEKGSTRRYVSARAFADDLGRWLHEEPTVARAEESPLLAEPIRLAKWMKRNRGLATAAGLAFAAIMVAVDLGLEAANTRAATAEREVRMQRLKDLLLRPREAGWSEKAWEDARHAGQLDANMIGRDVATRAAVQDAAAAILMGIDAHLEKRFQFISSSYMVFDPTGRRLLLGGGVEQDNPPPQRARLWNLDTLEEQLSDQPGPGPVAFSPDGNPLQVVMQDAVTYRVWNMERRQTVSEFAFPTDGLAGWKTASNKFEYPVMSIAPDGSVIAASAMRFDRDEDEPSDGAVAVWQATTGDLLHRLPVQATALCLSSDGDVLATGDASGEVVVWSIKTGKPVARFREVDLHVFCLAFGRNPSPSLLEDDDRPTLQLAVGYYGGNVTVWDLGRMAVRSHCRGIRHRVYGVAFSPDGRLLATGGYGSYLWDAATGQRLLQMNGDAGVAFSPDGQLIASAYPAQFGSPGNTYLYKLDSGRGIRALRGLAAPTQVVAFSAASKHIAGLSYDWKLGIWNYDTGELVHVLEAPRGYWADNVGLAFSADGQQVACVAGKEARLWDVATGERLRSWPLPRGQIDQIAFEPSGKLLAFRIESESGGRITQFDWVCRVRDLFADRPSKPLVEIRAFPYHVVHLVATPDGKYFAIEGELGPDGDGRALKVFDSVTGEEKWSIALHKKLDQADLFIDPTGRFLGFRAEEGLSEFTVVTIPDGQLVGKSSNWRILGPEALVTCRESYDQYRDLHLGASLFRRGHEVPLVTLPIVSLAGMRFNLSGTHIAAGNTDGTVTVCDLPEIQRTLAQIGLGW